MNWWVMLNYIIRRFLYAIPILIGVNLITFTLFFVVNTPDDMARMQLGIKRVTPEAIAKWKQERGYDQPLMFNEPGSRDSKLRIPYFSRNPSPCSLSALGAPMMAGISRTKSGPA